jgi:hypothetical protein
MGKRTLALKGIEPRGVGGGVLSSYNAQYLRAEGLFFEHPPMSTRPSTRPHPVHKLLQFPLPQKAFQGANCLQQNVTAHWLQRSIAPVSSSPKTFISSKEQTASRKMSPPTILTGVFDATEAIYTGLLKSTTRVVSSPVFPSRPC